MAIRLPPSPKNRGVLGLVVALGFVGWTAYMLATYSDKKPQPQLAKGASYIEVDLRGPRFELGRYQGYQKGVTDRKNGLTNSATLAETADDFSAGYQSGYAQAVSEIKPSGPRK